LYGEFIHAFQDSYSHRFQDNEPIAVLNWVGGIGHALLGSQPDYTYNDILIYEDYDDVSGAWQLRQIDAWRYREARTLAMEEQLFTLFQLDFGNQGASLLGDRVSTADDGFGDIITWQMLAGNGLAEVLTGNVDALGYPLDSQGRPRDSFGNILEVDTGRIISRGDEPAGQLIQFQRTCDPSAGGDGCGGGGVLQQFNQARNIETKRAILNDFLALHGFEHIPVYQSPELLKGRPFGNDMYQLAKQNRQRYLGTGYIHGPLNVQNDFLGVILPSGNDAKCIGGEYDRLCR
jgi:hypothetical protein